MPNVIIGSAEVDEKDVVSFLRSKTATNVWQNFHTIGGTMSFKSFLSAVGHDVLGVFSFLGSAKGQSAITGIETVATTIATVINPGAGAALSGIEALFNAGLKEIISIETVATAAGQQSGTGAQKAAAVISAIAPQTAAFLQSIGVSNPTAVQSQAIATTINNGIVAVLNSIPAPVASTTPVA